MINLAQLAEHLKKVYETIPSEHPFNFKTLENKRHCSVTACLYDTKKDDVFYKGRTFYFFGKDGKIYDSFRHLYNTNQIQEIAKKDVEKFNLWTIASN